jgi:hypothetical protein
MQHSGERLTDGFLFPGARCGNMLTSVILLISTKNSGSLRE